MTSRASIAKRLGAPIELCIECLGEFLGPEGVDVSIEGRMEGGTRTCCSLRCAIRYGTKRDTRAEVMVKRRRSGIMLAFRGGDDPAWTIHPEGRRLLSQEVLAEEGST